MDQHYFEGISADLIYHQFSSVQVAEFLNVLPSGFGNKIVAEKCCDETNHSKKSISHGTTHSCHGNGEYLKKNKNESEFRSRRSREKVIKELKGELIRKM